MTVLDRAQKMILSAFPELWALYLFGSHGTPYERKESDLGLALLAEKPFSTVELWKLSQNIARVIDKDVQLVDLRQVSTVFQNEILRQEKRIYCAEPRECDLLENAYLSLYLKLNEERAELLKDIANG